jgi:hypothetical protein
MVAEVLLDFERQLGLPLERKLVFDGQGVVDAGELIGELDIHHWANDLDNFAFIHAFRFVSKSLGDRELAAPMGSNTTDKHR